MFSLCFNIFIHSLIMLQSVTVSAPMLVNNISVLIQSCCLCYVHQIMCFADICNIMNVCWCDYCHLLNKLCHLVSSMQNIKKLLMSRRFCSISMPPPTTFCASTVAPTTRLQFKTTIKTMLHFVMWHRGFPPVSFKLIKSLL